MRNRYVLLLDLLLIVVAAAGAFALRFDWFFLVRRPEFRPFVIAALLAKPVVFLWFGMYRRYWRYATVADLIFVVLAVSAASVAMTTFVAAGMFTGFLHEFSRAVLPIDWLLSLFLAGGARLSVRIVGEARDRAGDDARPGVRQRRVLVVGAGDTGTMIAREMRRTPKLGMVPIAFVDDDRVKIGKRILGLPVLGDIAALRALVTAHPVDEVVIAIPSAAGSTLGQIVEACRAVGIPSRTLPGAFELLDDRVSVSRLRHVDISDLLRRPTVAGRPERGAYLTGKRVLVTGAGGSIGLELSRQVLHAAPSALFLLGHGENSIFEAQTQLREHLPQVPIVPLIADIRDRARLEQLFAEARPQVVFHAAAHKHVPLMEDNPEEAITNNILGTKNVVDVSRQHNVQRFVLISTDKAVAPTSLMGASKRLAEAIVRQTAMGSNRAFAVVRFGNVLGSRGSVVPHFKRQLERGGPITITHPDMKRYFMTIPEAVHLVLQAGGLAQGGELFVLDMGKPMRIVDLAQDLIRLSGLSPEEMPIVFTGVRQGEKLEERLWEHDAVVEPTAHPEVLRVVETEIFDREDVARVIDRLVTVAGTGDRLRIEAALADLLPSFVPALSGTESTVVQMGGA